MTTKDRNKEEGFVLITVAVVLLAVIGFVALGVDVGVLYGARTSAQQVADAAALAGAFTFINNPTAVQPDTAYNHALQVALNNSVLGTPVAAADVTVTVDVANRTVKVDISSTQNTYFAHALGVDTAAISTEGIAEAAKYSTGAMCVKPWFIPNTVFGSGGPCAACSANQVLISGGEVTDFARSQFGTEFILKSQDPSASISPGQFYAIQLPGSVGGADYRANIASCETAYLRCGNSYSVETGNLVGPTKQGVQDLIGNPPTDSWTGTIGEYQTANGLSDTSKNVVVAPIWDSCAMAGFCPAGNFPSGTTVSLQIIGFATFFLEDVQGGNVKARLISVSSCGGAAGGGVGGGENGGTVLSLPLRLVRMP
jgi:Tfp pilus assembly protein PilX